MYIYNIYNTHILYIQDIVNVLPDFFADTPQNKAFIKNGDAQKLAESVKIPDAKYEAFVSAYKKK